MSLRFYLLGSGSTGNVGVVSTFWEGSEYQILVDAGLSWRACRQRAPFINPRALLLTHEHSDHVRFAAQYARSLNIPIYATPGTQIGTPDLQKTEVCPLSPGKIVHIGPIAVLPFSVPHDAAEPVGFVFQTQHSVLGWLTDLGEITPAIEKTLQTCDALVIECNHDADRLWKGPYPSFLKRRIGGNKGHLSNIQAAKLLQKLAPKGRLRLAVLAHLSQKNNSPLLAKTAAKAAIGRHKIRLVVAEPRRCLGPFDAFGPATQLSLF